MSSSRHACSTVYRGTDGRPDRGEQTLRQLTIAVTLVTLLAACEAAAPVSTEVPASPTPVIKVAFVRDLSVPDADEHALPAMQAVRLAFETTTLLDPGTAPVELEEFDLQQGTAELEEIDADPSYVSVILAPGVDGDAAALDVDLPVVSLSGLGAGDGRRAWIRMVTPLVTVAGALAARLGRSSACIFSESPPPDPLFGLLAERLPGATARQVEPADAADVAREAGCDTVIWAGGPDAGGEAAPGIRLAGLAFVGGDRLLDPDFLSAAGIAAEGSFALCACANVSTSTELATRRFIQDYQSQFGAAPAAYAVEGWDAAHVILRALRDAGTSRPEVGSWLGAVAAYDGLSRVYRFGTDGELVQPGSAVRIYRLVGGRWVAIRST
jgi:Periplasmic binding protein